MDLNSLTPDQIREQIHLLTEIRTRKLASQNLSDFVEYVMGHVPAKHHKIFCDKSQKAIENGNGRCIFCAPPGYAKSTYLSHGLPAFAVGKYPGIKIISASHTFGLAEDFGKKVRNTITESKYRNVFPDCILSSDTRAAGKWSTTQRSTYFAVGVGGSVVGQRGNLIIIDDPFSGREAAYSPTIRKKVWDWYISDAKTRLLPGGTILIICTRWHEDDLSGELLRRSLAGDGDKFELVSLPVLCNDPENDPLGRKLNEPLWPEFYTYESVIRLKNTTPRLEWESLYMQNPTPDGGMELDKEWFGVYTSRDQIPKPYRIIQSWDTAQKADQKNTPSVCITAAVTLGKEYFILDVFRDHIRFKDLISKIKTHYREWGANSCYIENKGSGISALDLLRHQGMNFIPVQPEDLGSKEFRFDKAVGSAVASGRVHLPKHAKWLDDFLYELLVFPGGKYRDQVDAFSQLINTVETVKSRGMARLII